MPILTERSSATQQQMLVTLSRTLEPEQPTPPTTADVQVLADALLRDATRVRASDIHLDVQRENALLRFRIDGTLVEASRLDLEPARRITNQFKTLTSIDPVNLFTPEESRVTYSLGDREVDLRVSFAPCVGGEKMTVRVLDPRQLKRDISELGLNDSAVDKIGNWLRDVNGMFLVTGPTGTGKTTTLYALLHELRLLKGSIITLEDPVEYQIDEISQLQVDDEHDFTFRNGLKSMLRLDPDFLLLGEIRDAESAHTAVRAASSGHVLLSTLHSHDPVGAVTTLRNWGLEDHEVTAALQVVVSQRLLRKLCPKCRRQEKPDSREEAWLKAIDADVPDQVWHAVGCDECFGLGYHGRVGIFEVWRLRDRDLELIGEHSREQVLRQHLNDTDHETLLTDALAKAQNGQTTISELMGGRLIPHGGGSLAATETGDQNKSEQQSAAPAVCATP